MSALHKAKILGDKKKASMLQDYASNLWQLKNQVRPL
jgi:hypothetical protein